MIRGARKQMIVIRTGNSQYFDEAYFVLRREMSDKRGDQTDILNEANRILSESASDTVRRDRHKLWRWLFFLAGTVCGAACATVTALLILL